MSEKLAFLWDALLALVGLAGILWVCFRVIQDSEHRGKMLVKMISTLVFVVACFHYALKLCESGQAFGGVVAPFIMVVMGIVLSIMWTPTIGDFITKPLTNLYDGGGEPQELKPLYSIALAKRQRGKFLEATVAVREQLAKFPNDMEGVMLLARIQAEDMKDIPSAEMTLNHFCASPKVAPGQFSAAMTTLADWHLQIAQDADSARQALEKIAARYPDTELALVAAQRIGHLAGVEKIMLEKADRQALAVPEGVNNVGLLESSEFLRPTEEDPAKLAGVYVKHLEKHPLDTEVREKLAVIYADHYHRLDMAIMELAQMIELPNQPPKRVAHWLTVLANLQIRHGADYDAVRQTLEKIVTAFPNLPVAQSAQSRINHLKLEFKGRQEEGPAKQLGVYEQNLGLKSGRPKRLQ